MITANPTNPRGVGAIGSPFLTTLSRPIAEATQLKLKLAVFRLTAVAYVPTMFLSTDAVSAGSFFDIVYRSTLKSLPMGSERDNSLPWFIKSACYAKYDSLEFRVFVFDPALKITGGLVVELVSPPPAGHGVDRSVSRLAPGSCSAAPRESKPLDAILRWAWGPSIASRSSGSRGCLPGCVRLFRGFVRRILGSTDGESTAPLDAISRWTWGPSFTFHRPPPGNPVPLPPAGVCR